MSLICEEASSVADGRDSFCLSDSSDHAVFEVKGTCDRELHSPRAAKKAKIARHIVDTVLLSALISSYNAHFANYSVGRAKVTQVIPGKVWKAVYEDNRNNFPDSTFTEDALKVRVREDLSQLDTGTSNQGNSRAELQP
jgi:hypothetical protein